MSKLAYQVQVARDDVRSMVRATWPRAIKVLQDGVDRTLLGEMADHGLELVVGRYVFPESGNPDEVHGRCNVLIRWADENLGWLRDRGVRVVLEVPYNEELQNGEALDRLTALTRTAMARIAAAGYDVGIGVFSEGNPSGQGHPDPFVDWPKFHPALRAARTLWLETKTRAFLCLHEYGVPALGVVDTWHNFRYRRVWERLPEDCRVPILITESGIDGGIEGRRKVGWRGYMDAPRYAEWLWTTRRELETDPYVWFSFLFLCGGNDDWTLFDVKDEVDLRDPLRSDGARPRWQPTKEVPVNADPPLKALAQEKARKYRLDWALLDRQVQQESSWNPKAVSKSGAKGLMQLMDGTARDLGVTDPFDPAQNLEGGCRYLRMMLDRFGDYDKALAAYNWGPKNLADCLALHPTDWRAYVSKQAQSYLDKILGPAAPPPQPLPPMPKGDPLTTLRDETWALANRWADLGYPWLSQSMKGLVALSKGEK